jgi:hypothetical protein
MNDPKLSRWAVVLAACYIGGCALIAVWLAVRTW